MDGAIIARPRRHPDPPGRRAPDARPHRSPPRRPAPGTAPPTGSPSRPASRSSRCRSRCRSSRSTSARSATSSRTPARSCPAPTRRWPPSSATRCASTRSPAPCRPSRSRTWSPSATSPWSPSGSRWSPGSPARSRTTSSSSAPTAGCSRSSSRSWSPASTPSASWWSATTCRPASARKPARGGASADLEALSPTELVDPAAVAGVLGLGSGEHLDGAVAPRGYRLLAKVPRLPARGRRPARRALRQPAEAALRRHRRPPGRRGRRRAAGPQRARGPLPAGRVEHPRALRLRQPTRCERCVSGSGRVGSDLARRGERRRPVRRRSLEAVVRLTAT